MGITVNEYEITDDAIAAELPHHQNEASPLDASVRELILRKVLLDRAVELGISADTPEDTIDALLKQEVKTPEPDEEACRRYYEANRQKFTHGELIEASHILFQVTETVPLELLRETAASILGVLRETPEAFEQLARQYSNCPSGAVGGNLGQIGRGVTVPEFEDVLFRLPENTLNDRLVESRFGLHIIKSGRKAEGHTRPFEEVRQPIAEYLSHSAYSRALHQYLQIQVGQADISGYNMNGATSPLVQ